MSFVDFSGENGFEKETGLTPNKLASLAQINRRTMVVGLFNGANRGQMYFWGPRKKMEQRQHDLRAEDKKRYHFVRNNNYAAFLNAVQPLIQERILTTKDQLAVSVGVPSGKTVSKATTNVVNTYVPLYEGGREKGQQLLARIERNVDRYLDLLRDFAQVKAEFNLFAFNSQRLSQEHHLPHPKGESFHPGFDEVFLDYLLREDENIAFDSKWLDWKGWSKGAGYSPDDRAVFADLVTAFKRALLDEKPNAVDCDVRTVFSERRQAVLDLGKTVSSNLMLSQLPYWILRLLYGVQPSEVDPELTERLHEQITARDGERRKLRIEDLAEDVVLAAPQTQLEKDERKRVAETLTAKIGDIVLAWGTRQEDREEVVDALAEQGVSASDIAAIKSGLNIIDRICDGDEKRAKAMRSSLVSVLETQYLKLLIGKPVTFLEEIIDWYALDLCDAYMQGELYKDDAAKLIRESAREQRERLNDPKLTDEDGHILDERRSEAMGSLLSGFLVPTMSLMTEDILQKWRALEKFALLRAQSLKEGFDPGLGMEAKKHSEKSAGDGLGKTIATPTSDAVKELVSISAEAEASVGAATEAGSSSGAAGAPAPGAESGASESRAKDTPKAAAAGADEAPKSSAPEGGSETGTSEPEAPDARDLRAELRDLLADLRDEEQPDKPAEDRFIELATAAYELIWSTRERNDVPDEFRQLCRKIGMREIYIAKNDTLQFGKDLSSLYQMTLDLLGVGSQNPLKFLSTYSLTNYFDLPDDDHLWGLYRRLNLQTKEAAESMARFISEVMCFDYLFEKIKDQLAETHELIFFNGTALDFLDWLEERRNKVRNDWAPTALGDPEQLLPGLLYITESALVGVESSSAKGAGVVANNELIEQFMQRLKKLNLNGDGVRQPCTMPPIMLATAKPFDTSFEWTKPFRDHSGYVRNDSQFPCPIFYVGPARERGHRVTGAKITLPAAAFVLETVYTGRSSETGCVHQQTDPQDQSLQDHEFSFTANVQSIDERAATLMNVGNAPSTNGDGPPPPGAGLPLDAAMWLHSVGVLYLYLANRYFGKFYDGVEGDFWNCLRTREQIVREIMDQIRNQREAISPCLQHSDNLYCVAGPELLHVWQPEPPYRLEARFSVPWFSKLLRESSKEILQAYAKSE